MWPNECRTCVTYLTTRGTENTPIVSSKDANYHSLEKESLYRKA
jgi:hypothetical protein